MRNNRDLLEGFNRRNEKVGYGNAMSSSTNFSPSSTSGLPAYSLLSDSSGGQTSATTIRRLVKKSR